MSSDGNFDLRNDRLSEISDEELVRLSIDSRLSASYMSELIYRYFGFIKGKAAAMCITPSSYDDFVQEGLLGFLSAVRNFDSSKGAKFSFEKMVNNNAHIGIAGDRFEYRGI